MLKQQRREKVDLDDVGHIFLNIADLQACKEKILKQNMSDHFKFRL